MGDGEPELQYANTLAIKNRVTRSLLPAQLRSLKPGGAPFGSLPAAS